jgi:zinc transporter ZupT
MAHLVEYIAVILAVAAIGGVLPFVRRWRSEVLHLFIAFGAGVFLGAVFFHLLPDVRASRDAFVFVLAGFLLVLLFEQLTAGFALGVGMLADPELGFVMFFAIVAHKAVAAFSLATVLRLSTFSVRRSVCLLIAFALTTPVGAVVAYVLMSGLSPKAIQVPTALAAGTFLYVATMDLLPEAFHVRGRRRAAGLSMLVGLAAMLLISYVGP